MRPPQTPCEEDSRASNGADESIVFSGEESNAVVDDHDDHDDKATPHEAGENDITTDAAEEEVLLAAPDPPPVETADAAVTAELSPDVADAEAQCTPPPEALLEDKEAQAEEEEEKEVTPAVLCFDASVEALLLLPTVPPTVAERSTSIDSAFIALESSASSSSSSSSSSSDVAEEVKHADVESIVADESAPALPFPPEPELEEASTQTDAVEVEIAPPPPPPSPPPPPETADAATEPLPLIAVHDKSVEAFEEPPAPIPTANAGTSTADENAAEEAARRALWEAQTAAAVEAAVANALADFADEQSAQAAAKAALLRVSAAQTDDGPRCVANGQQCDVVAVAAMGTQCERWLEADGPEATRTATAVATALSQQQLIFAASLTSPPEASAEKKAEEEEPAPPAAIKEGGEGKEAEGEGPIAPALPSQVSHIVRKATEHRFVANFSDDSGSEGGDYHDASAHVHQYTVTAEVTDAAELPSASPLSGDWHRLGAGLAAAPMGAVASRDEDGNDSLVCLFGPEVVHHLKAAIVATRGARLTPDEVAARLPLRCEEAARHHGFANLYRSLLVMYHLNA